MKKKRSFKIAGKLIGGLILLLGILFVVGKLFLDPYRYHKDLVIITVETIGLSLKF